MQSPGLLAKFARGAGAALTVQLISAALLYAAQVWLARWLGTTAYGVYEYATAISIIGAFIASFGMPSVALRLVSAYRAQSDWARLGGLMRGSWRQLLLASIGIAGCGTGIWAWLQTSRDLGMYTWPLLLGIWSIPGLTLLNLQKEIIRGFQQIVLAFAPSLIGQPLVLLGLASGWRSHRPFTSTVAMALSFTAVLLILLLQWSWFQTQVAPQIRRPPHIYETALWWRIALPLVLMGGSYMILSHTDTLMIGLLLNAQQVGIYSAALKTAAWVPFILIAVNAMAAPLIATLYAQDDQAGLQQLVAMIARWMFYPALGMAIAIMLFSRPILQLFGAEFVAAQGTLVVLMLGQLVNVGAGSVGYLMTMTTYQNQAAGVMAVSALVNVMLNVVGIPVFGILGAAIATALSMALWNVWLYSLVVQKLGVRPSILDTF
ncbi:flippase [Halomicronema sp. CCY15110]|uniref:flippase n=1 Tax=Halomicronema sp. CCY15110 TaxID=2767773 RepID=UPI002814CF07|nr:flippase [Halomicronema sp. CCY15110]